MSLINLKKLSELKDYHLMMKDIYVKNRLKLLTN